MLLERKHSESSCSVFSESLGLDASFRYVNRHRCDPGVAAIAVSESGLTRWQIGGKTPFLSILLLRRCVGIAALFFKRLLKEWREGGSNGGQLGGASLDWTPQEQATAKQAVAKARAKAHASAAKRAAAEKARASQQAAKSAQAKSRARALAAAKSALARGRNKLPPLPQLPHAPPAQPQAQGQGSQKRSSSV